MSQFCLLMSKITLSMGPNNTQKKRLDCHDIGNCMQHSTGPYPWCIFSVIKWVHCASLPWLGLNPIVQTVQKQGRKGEDTQTQVVYIDKSILLFRGHVSVNSNILDGKYFS